jgi:hypothetical protein
MSIKLDSPAAIDTLIAAADSALIFGMIAMEAARNKPFESEVDRILGSSSVNNPTASTTAFFGSAQKGQEPGVDNSI